VESSTFYNTLSTPVNGEIWGKLCKTVDNSVHSVDKGQKNGLKIPIKTLRTNGALLNNLYTTRVIPKNGIFYG